ncbi:hypothetical protein HC031_31720 [Planosporangium thailandense]|uniref:Uncharacterized protein n=1 Tax=Planosporangium thailandense TaxID=765197 RepID=A0ABX0Y748_9ACTN|nr:hypothetical protein [Planosporangium thailandense]NJC74249.1 hypothetical protein [Planosporangium thailandense]
MTVTPSWDLGTGMGLELECDNCGYVISRPGTDRTDWHALWAAARRLGWDGAAGSTGRHSCPDCVSVLDPVA